MATFHEPMNFRRIRIGTGRSPMGGLLLAGAGVAALAGIVLLSIFGGLLLVGLGLLASGVAAGAAMLRHFLGGKVPMEEKISPVPGEPRSLPKWQGKHVAEIIDVEESEVTLLGDEDSRPR